MNECPEKEPLDEWLKTEPLDEDSTIKVCSYGLCKNPFGSSDCRFFQFPSAHADPERRRLWASWCNRINTEGRTWEPDPNTEHVYVCSEHFVTGEPWNDKNHQDYAPTILCRTVNGQQRQKTNNAVKRLCIGITEENCVEKKRHKDEYPVETQHWQDEDPVEKKRRQAKVRMQRYRERLMQESRRRFAEECQNQQNLQLQPPTSSQYASTGFMASNRAQETTPEYTGDNPYRICTPITNEHLVEGIRRQAMEQMTRYREQLTFENPIEMKRQNEDPAERKRRQAKVRMQRYRERWRQDEDPAERKRQNEDPAERKRQNEDPAEMKRQNEDPAEMKRQDEDPAERKRQNEDPAERKRRLTKERQRRYRERWRQDEDPAERKRQNEDPAERKRQNEDPAERKRQNEDPAERKRRLTKQRQRRYRERWRQDSGMKPQEPTQDTGFKAREITPERNAWLLKNSQQRATETTTERKARLAAKAQHEALRRARQSTLQREGRLASDALNYARRRARQLTPEMHSADEQLCKSILCRSIVSRTTEPYYDSESTTEEAMQEISSDQEEEGQSEKQLSAYMSKIILKIYAAVNILSLRPYGCGMCDELLETEEEFIDHCYHHYCEDSQKDTFLELFALNE